jgi:hypothetical protein
VVFAFHGAVRFSAFPAAGAGEKRGGAQPESVDFCQKNRKNVSIYNLIYI